MNAELADSTGALLTLALHSTVWLGCAALVDRGCSRRRPALAERVWRLALFGALASTLLALLPVPPASIPMPWPDPHSTVSGDGPVVAATRSPPAGADLLPTRATPPPRSAGSAAPVASPALTLPGWFAAPLVLGWLLATTVLLLVTLARIGGLLALRLRAGRRPLSGALHAEAERLSGQLGLPRGPLLSRDDRLTSPVALPGHALLLPGWVAELPPAQRRALLVHELSHLRRRDPVLRLLQRLALVPLAWQPLAWIASRRLDALAEQACDDAAARLLGSGRPLAECLAACLRQQAGISRSPRLAVAMAARDSDVVRRVTRLLKESPMSQPTESRRQRGVSHLLAVALAAALVSAGGIVVSTEASAGLRWSSNSEIEHDDGDREFTVTLIDDGNRLRVKGEGDIRFSDDERRVQSMADGARLQIEQTVDGVERELRLRGVDGEIEPRYEVDGETMPWDADAEAWLAALIPELFRRTGMDAERRLQRLLARGGAPAAIAEIRQIPADHVRAIYLGMLLADPTLAVEPFDQAVGLLGNLESDFELRRALTRALQDTADPARRAALLTAADGIGSDFERAELLGTVAERPLADPALLAAWQQVAAGIDSGFERRRAIEALLDASPGAGATRVALALAGDIDSDFELRSLLERAAPRALADPTSRTAWFDAARGIDSDFERRSALQTLAGAGALDADAAERMLRLIEGIGSEFERRESLVALAEAMPADPALIERYRSVARTLGDFERGQAERALDRFAMQ